ncbi:MAG: cobalamin-binding protein [Acidimicrobiales bacterium]|nr:MAG: cobalamin-binding protein [Acidimicrobiales bacterium]
MLMRVVSLLPSATEIVASLGRGDWLVGRSSECDHPSWVRRLPVVSRARLEPGLGLDEIDRRVSEQIRGGEPLYELDVGLLEELRPDLVVTQDLCPVCAVSSERVLGALESCGFGSSRILALDPHTLEDVLDDIARVGEVLDCRDRAASLVARLRARIDAVMESHRPVRRPRVAVLEWVDPPYSAGHWIPEMVHLAGGEEVTGAVGEPSRAITWESLADARPDIIVVAPCGFRLADAEEQAARVLQRAELADTAAVRSGRVHAVDADAEFARPGPRLVDGVETLARIVRGS